MGRRWRALAGGSRAWLAVQLLRITLLAAPHHTAPARVPCPLPVSSAGERALRSYLDEFDRKYWATYKVLDILQKARRGRGWGWGWPGGWLGL